jgi:hypothetical protein
MPLNFLKKERRALKIKVKSIDYIMSRKIQKKIENCLERNG